MKLRPILDEFYMRLIFILPKRLIAHCAMHVLTNASVGKFSNVELSEIPAYDALKYFVDRIE